MSSLSMVDLHAIFNRLDRNGDGFVSLDELMWLLERVGVYADQDELRLLLGKDALNLVDFLFFCETLEMNRESEDDSKVKAVHEIEEEGGITERDLRKAFQVFDLNNDGFISCEELEMTLSRLGLWDKHGGGDCRSMICAYDANSDGLLDFEEFKKMMMMMA